MSAVSSGGEAKNIKPMQVWTDLTLLGNAVTRPLSPVLDRVSSLVSAAPFTEVVWGAKRLIFPAAAPESQPALALDEGALSLSLCRGDSVWSLLTRHSVPVPPLLTWVPMSGALCACPRPVCCSQHHPWSSPVCRVCSVPCLLDCVVFHIAE